MNVLTQNIKQTALILLTCVSPFAGMTQKKDKPNVVVFITDDQHRFESNFLPEGRAENGTMRNLSPALDRLASEGVVFTNQHVVAGICTPSRFSILTGIYPSRATNAKFLKEQKACSQVNPHFNLKVTNKDFTLAKLFKGAGYFTGGVGKNHVIRPDEIGSGHRLKKGMSREETLERLMKIQKDEIASYKACGFDFAKNIYPGNIPGFLPRFLEFHNTDWIIQGAFDFLDESAKKEEPFFLYCATTVSHGPSKLGQKYKGDRKATAEGFLDEEVKVMPTPKEIEERIEKLNLSDEAKDVLWLDDAVNALVTKLEKMGELDNTIIFFMTDNAVEHGKFTCYEGGTRTPSFYWGPKFFQSGKQTDAYASNVDILPTLADLCDITLPKSYAIDGSSLAPILKGKSDKVHESLYLEVGATRALVKDGWKYLAFRVPVEKKNMPLKRRQKLARKDVDPYAPYTHICDRPGGRGGESPAMRFYPNYYDSDQLYNLKDDPNELNNLAKEPAYQKKLQELKKELKVYLNKTPGTFGELKK